MGSTKFKAKMIKEALEDRKSLFRHTQQRRRSTKLLKRLFEEANTKSVTILKAGEHAKAAQLFLLVSVLQNRQCSKLPLTVFDQNRALTSLQAWNNPLYQPFIERRIKITQILHASAYLGQHPRSLFRFAGQADRVDNFAHVHRHPLRRRKVNVIILTFDITDRQAFPARRARPISFCSASRTGFISSTNANARCPDDKSSKRPPSRK